MIYLLIAAIGIILVLIFVALCLGVLVAEARKRADQAETVALARAAEQLKRHEKAIRTDAVKRSAAVVQGKVAEHLVPFREDFDYNPRDCRFLGSPVDFICFDGMTEGTLDRIIFIEVKAGRFKSLSGREQQVRDIIDEGEVYWELLHIGGNDAGT